MPDRRWRGPAAVGIPVAAVTPAGAVIRVGLRTSVVLRTWAAAGRILPVIQAAVRRILQVVLAAVRRISPVIQVADGRTLLPGALRTLPLIVELVGRTLLRMAV